MKYDGPPPGTASPQYERHANVARTSMRDRSSGIVKLATFQDAARLDIDPPIFLVNDLKIVALTIRRMSAPAPYVGRPFDYTWRVAVDSNNEGVADTEVSIRYTDYYEWGENDRTVSRSAIDRAYGRWCDYH